MWNPDVYGSFAAERSAPFEDLLALVRVRPNLRVIDLGCGTGELTARLRDALPGAEVLGIDASGEMLERASALERPGLRFERMRIEEVAGSFDLIASNAALQWVDDHARRIPALFALLRPEGQLVVQMPAWRRPAAYGAIVETARSEPHCSALGRFEQQWPVLPIEDYAEMLAACGATELIALDKVYPHVLRDADALADWQSGTALLPYRERLGPHEYAGFEAAVRSRLRARWPGSPVFFPFRRTLLAATHPGAESATPRPVLASGRTAGST
jgi:trans-aconitate 2-methyltransferase